jgi:hypothetical protein
VSYFAAVLGEYATETFELLKIAFGGQTVGRTQVFNNFPRSKQCDILKLLNTQDIHGQAEQMKVRIE